jgi:hypothetical protein
MKHINKIFEFESLDSVIRNRDEARQQKKLSEEIETRQDLINSYNNMLIRDQVWKDFYHKIDRYDLKGKDPKFLDEIIEFAKKRIAEIEKEDEENLQLVKDLAIDYLEDCESFGSINTSYLNKASNEILIKINFSKKCLYDRKSNFNSFRILEEEVLEYWESIIQLFKVLKSNGFNSSIRYYQPSGVEMWIIVTKNEDI